MSECQRKRNVSYTVYLSQEERELLRKGAYELKLSQSEYMRRLIVDGPENLHPLIDDRFGQLLITEISRIADAIRYISYNVSEEFKEENPDFQELEKDMMKVLDLIGQLVYV